MEFNQYQDEAKSTAVYPDKYKITYPILGLTGEAGELANKFKKVIRDDGEVLSEQKRQELIDELGDVLWYLSAIASDLGASLNDVAIKNIDKLNARMKKGTIKGSGDNR